MVVLECYFVQTIYIFLVLELDLEVEDLEVEDLEVVLIFLYQL